MTRRRLFLLAIWVLALLLAGTALATAASNSGYSIDWYTVDGGGGTSRGGSYSVSGSIGQPDAGTLSGGSYSLAGGFRGGGAPLFGLYLPLTLK